MEINDMATIVNLMVDSPTTVKCNTTQSVTTSTVANYDIETRCKEFLMLLKDKSEVESFIFFTDPHLAEFTGWESNYVKYINALHNAYNSTPTSYVVCGGDWLGHSDTKDYACFKLAYIDDTMKTMFDNYYHVVGNHDTNYQGKLSEDAEIRTGTLGNEVICNLWFKDKRKAYYYFDGTVTRNYVLDTQLDVTDTTMDDYKWLQLDWLATELLKNDLPHSAIYMHIAFINDSNDFSEMAINLGKIISAYNNRITVVLNDRTYDFTKCSGRIDYILSGHIHRDYSALLGGVNCIATTWMRDGKTPSFDLCFSDYDNRKLYMIRVGTGENRLFDF